MGIFGNTKRNTLSAAEVSALWHQYMGDSMAICVYKYFLKIVENKEIKPMQQDHLPIPKRWDTEITDSTVSPFSDKLMMFHAALLVNAALSYYGAALGSSLRSDIILNYKSVFNHETQAGALCFKILVKHRWLEKQPEAVDRKSLS